MNTQKDLFIEKYLKHFSYSDTQFTDEEYYKLPFFDQVVKSDKAWRDSQRLTFKTPSNSERVILSRYKIIGDESLELHFILERPRLFYGFVFVDLNSRYLFEQVNGTFSSDFNDYKQERVQEKVQQEVLDHLYKKNYKKPPKDYSQISEREKYDYSGQLLKKLSLLEGDDYLCGKCIL